MTVNEIRASQPGNALGNISQVGGEARKQPSEASKRCRDKVLIPTKSVSKTSIKPTFSAARSQEANRRWDFSNPSFHAGFEGPSRHPTSANAPRLACNRLLLSGSERAPELLESRYRTRYRFAQNAASGIERGNGGGNGGNAPYTMFKSLSTATAHAFVNGFKRPV